MVALVAVAAALVAVVERWPAIARRRWRRRPRGHRAVEHCRVPETTGGERKRGWVRRAQNGPDRDNTNRAFKNMGGETLVFPVFLKRKSKPAHILDPNFALLFLGENAYFDKYCRRLFSCCNAHL